MTISYVPRDYNKAAHVMAAIAVSKQISLKWNCTTFLQRISSTLAMDICNSKFKVKENWAHARNQKIKN